MKNFHNSLIAILIAPFAALSCSKSEQPQTQEIPHQSSLITEQSALSNLDKFLGQTKSPLSAANERTISEYSFDDKVGDTPDLHLVNYDDESGCAILAANTLYPDILAVVENGNVDDNLRITSSSTDRADELASVQQLTNNIREYCLEVRETGFASGVASKSFACCPTPLLDFSWDQGDYNQCGVYNKYCTKMEYLDNINQISGCAIAAIASVIANNSFPKLSVNNQVLDYQGMTSEYKATKLSDFYKEQVSLLYGVVFMNCLKFCFQNNGTLSLPASVKSTLEKFGYENVRELSSSNDNFNELVWEVSDMLEKCKPTIFLAMASDDIFNAHYWIIDGAKQANYADQLLHFNFCWEGAYNGWFSIYSLFNKTNARQYDDYYTEKARKEGTLSHDGSVDYTRFYRLFTYDIPLNSENYGQIYML